MHRLIRRASMAFIGFGLMVSWFASFIGNILGVAYLAVVLILPYIFTKIYLKSYPTKKYSKFFIKNQRLCLTIFTVENFASIALILYPLVPPCGHHALDKRKRHGNSQTDTLHGL